MTSGLTETSGEYQERIYGVANTKGKSFSCHEAAERYLETFIAAGKTEEVKDAVSTNIASSVPAGAAPFAVGTPHLPAVAVDMGSSGHPEAFVVLRGYAPGVYRTW